MINPLISVIIPVYNSERYLSSCIDSLQPSRNNDIEIILVDDGSTDSSSTLVDEYDESNENIHSYHKINGGSASARNLGLKNSKGQWIWFVDSDDIVSPIAFVAWKKALKLTNVDLLYSPVHFFDFEDKLKWDNDVDVSQYISGLDFLRGTYRGVFHHFNWEFLYSRALLEECAIDLGESLSSLYREDVYVYEDVLFCETLLRHAKEVAILSSHVYACRNNKESVTNKPSNQSVKSGLIALDALDEYPVSADLKNDKVNMELGLLFSLYKLIETGSFDLKKIVRGAINERCTSVGFWNLNDRIKARYILLETRVIDFIIFVRRSFL